MKKWFIGLALIILLPACSVFKFTADVSSDTTWTGFFSDHSVSGKGSQSIDLGSGMAGPRCATVQKDTSQGYLTLTVDGQTQTTRTPYGTVALCSRNGV